jgi:ABC-type transport system substrate-binding protein
VPDVAQALPTVSADGRTYTFIVRPGFRFSPPSGAPVSAATFKHTIERTLAPNLRSSARNYMADVVGMPAFQTGRSVHLAGVTASGERLQIRLTRPAPDLPARIANMPFCAVPDDTPAAEQHLPIPSAGPYYIVPSSRDQLVLARNPNHGDHRPRVPKQIVYSFNVGLPRALREVTAGQSDYVTAAPFVVGGQSLAALGLLQALEQRYGPASAAARTGHQRYFVNPPWTWSPSSSTRRVRYSPRRGCAAPSTTRSTAARLCSTTSSSTAGRRPTTTWYRESPGHVRSTSIRSAVPTWGKARQLAEGVHAHATMYIPTGAPQFMEDAQIVQTDLKAIGITVDITALPQAKFWTSLARPGEPWDIAWANWGADFADPFTMINELYDPVAAPNPNFGRYHDPAITRRMRQAATLTGDRRLQAYARLDQAVTSNDPPGAALGIGTFREFFSARVGWQVYQPSYGVDLGSICLRQ